MTLEDAQGEAVGVWPDNLLAVNVFIAMGTQWRISANGATGLDYNALPVVMKMVGIPARDRPAVFEDVRVMEDAALMKMQTER